MFRIDLICCEPERFFSYAEDSEDRITTVLDALREGFTTCLITDATRVVNMKDGDFDRALEHMRKEGAKLIESREI